MTCLQLSAWLALCTVSASLTPQVAGASQYLGSAPVSMSAVSVVLVSAQVAAQVTAEKQVTSASPKHALLFIIVAIASLSASVSSRHGGIPVMIFSAGSLGPLSFPQSTYLPATSFILEDIYIHRSLDFVTFLCRSFRFGSLSICTDSLVVRFRGQGLTVQFAGEAWQCSLCSVRSGRLVSLLSASHSGSVEAVCPLCAVCSLCLSWWLFNICVSGPSIGLPFVSPRARPHPV